MKISILCFTEKGYRLGQIVRNHLPNPLGETQLFRCGKGHASLTALVKSGFSSGQALIFIGATGIAVRAIAPYVQDKTVDPAVLVLDEKGEYVIPLLAGHIGGANRLARQVAQGLGASLVLTTATDVQGVFAVDTWAVEQGLRIVNPAAIKTVSAKLLAGETVGLFSQWEITGPWPAGLAPQAQNRADICISFYESSGLHLVPPALVLGVGCRRGTPKEDIQAAFAQLCKHHQIVPQAVGRAATIDLKKEEPGLLAFCRRQALPLDVFTSEQLAAQGEGFTSSDFVKGVTGVDNVCERSARAAGSTRLLVRKTCYTGLALALGVREQSLSFTEEK